MLKQFLEDAALKCLFCNGYLYCFFIVRAVTLYLEIHLSLCWVSNCILAFLFLETRLRCWVSVNRFLVSRNKYLWRCMDIPRIRPIYKHALLSNSVCCHLQVWVHTRVPFLIVFFPLAKNIGFIVILALLLFQRAHFCCDGRNTWTDESIDSWEVNSIAKGWSDTMMR